MQPAQLSAYRSRRPRIDLPPHLASLNDLLLHRAEAQSEQIAYEFLDDGDSGAISLSYGELLARAMRVSELLRGRAVRGRPILLVYEPGLDFIAGFWACLLSGAVATPVAPPRARDRIDAISAIALDAGADIALTHTRCLARMQTAILRSATLSDITWLTTDDRVLAAPSTEGIPGQRVHCPLAVLQYSSGSTGSPRGIRLSHENILANEQVICNAFNHDRDTVVVGILPHFHDMGLMGNLLQPLYVGGRCVFMAPSAFARRPLRWLKAISRYGGTTSGGPNFAYDLCTEHADSAVDLDLSSWRVAFIGAEPVRAKTLMRFEKAFAQHGFRKRAFLPCYGLAEATLLAAATEPGAGVTASILGSGRPCGTPDLICCGHAPDGVRIEIVDPATMDACADGSEGEIWIAGPSVAAGYWRDRDGFSTSFDAHTQSGAGPYLRTGDLGFITAEGLFVSGRLKSCIIIDGRKYHAEDLECAITGAHPGISERSCALTLDGEEREQLVMLIERRNRAAREFDVCAAGMAVQRRLAASFGLVAQLVVFVPAGGLPHTTSGKLRRAACLTEFLDGTLREVGRWNAAAGVPGSAVSESDWEIRDWLLREIASRTGLQVSSVPTDELFAVLGLDSKDLFEICDALSVRLEREIEPTLLWECPTIDLLLIRVLREADVG